MPSRPKRRSMSLLPMNNPIQEYAWGSKQMLARFLGQEIPSPVPQAELWMGAHPQAPSQVWTNGEWRRLDQLVNEQPNHLLGKDLERFGPDLPFLLKVLAVDKPLSLQVHPNAKQAWSGFQREEVQAVPFQAPERKYKDPNPKPECICALDHPFWGLCGFRPPAEIIDWFSWLGRQVLEDEIHILGREVGESQEVLAEMLDSLLSMKPRRRRRVLEEAEKRVVRNSGHDMRDPAYWLGVLLHEYPQDISVLAALFLQLVHLEPGQAAFLPPGQLHAYLYGFGVEIMANSDNVLRAGLTSKHVDIQELLQILSFDSRPVEILQPEPVEPGWSRYSLMTEEFALSVLELGCGCSELTLAGEGVEILLCTHGELLVRDEHQGWSQHIRQGQSVCIPSCVPRWKISGQGRAFRAQTGI